MDLEIYGWYQAHQSGAAAAVAAAHGTLEVSPISLQPMIKLR